MADLRDLVRADERARSGGELGDVPFTALAVVRKAGLDPDLVQRRTLVKFRRCFARLASAPGPRLGQVNRNELLETWDPAVLAERDSIS